ncbi:hypothetical protein ALC60_00151 [Trachymyrmex zeteki]|uniref:Uncharacterized protein n=1 Tax=Mycetomoellerius zeteki TaxID=64791 RepID=A0A151XK51_9HYME|nr:hypothetical protein ALC60_00151 [Trachymyrmex zeteki]
MYIRVSHPRAFFDRFYSRSKATTAAHRRSSGSDTLSNVWRGSVHASRYTAMHVARSDRERPPRVPPLSRNAISRPFTTNVSDARIVYVTRLFTSQILQNFSTRVILLKRGTVKSREPLSAPMINRFAECLQNRRVALHARVKEREREGEPRPA